MWCDVVWCDVMWCDVMWCDVMCCVVMWCDVMWCDVMCCDVMWCDMMWCGVMWCDVMWCDVMWCDVRRAHLAEEEYAEDESARSKGEEPQRYGRRGGDVALRLEDEQRRERSDAVACGRWWVEGVGGKCGWRVWVEGGRGPMLLPAVAWRVMGGGRRGLKMRGWQ
jgi:hypothetical protein